MSFTSNTYSTFQIQKSNSTIRKSNLKIVSTFAFRSDTFTRVDASDTSGNAAVT